MTRFTDTRAAEPLATPRRLLLRVAAATGLGIVALAGMGDQDAAAKKKRNKKKKRKCKGKTSGPVTCAAVCPAEGGFAFHLFGGGDVCATGADPHDCVECDEDADCATVGPARMCARSFTNLAAGATGDFSALCGSYTRGICVVFEPCVLGA